MDKKEWLEKFAYRTQLIYFLDLEKFLIIDDKDINIKAPRARLEASRNFEIRKVLNDLGLKPISNINGRKTLILLNPIYAYFITIGCLKNTTLKFDCKDCMQLLSAGGLTNSALSRFEDFYNAGLKERCLDIELIYLYIVLLWLEEKKGLSRIDFSDVDYHKFFGVFAKRITITARLQNLSTLKGFLDYMCNFLEHKTYLRSKNGYKNFIG